MSEIMKQLEEEVREEIQEELDNAENSEDESENEDAPDDGNADDSGNEEDSNEEDSNEEELIEIDGEKFTREQVKLAVSNHLNDNAWKKRNEDRGRELNEAEKLKKRIESNPKLKQHIEAFEEDRLIELKDEIGDDELAKKIYDVEKENRELKRFVNESKASSVWEVEEKELRSHGATDLEIAQAYEIVDEYNSAYIKKHKKPMPLVDALGISSSRGGLGNMFKKIKDDMKKSILADMKKNKKDALPSTIPGQGSGVIKNKKEPANADEATDALFANDPLFAGVK